MAKRTVEALKALVGQSRSRTENIEDVISMSRPILKAKRAASIYGTTAASTASQQSSGAQLLGGESWGTGTGAGAAGAAVGTMKDQGKNLLELLSKGKIGTAFKTNPGTMGIGSALLLGMLFSKIKGLSLENMQENTTREGIQQQMDTDPEDMYYQAMMPDLMQQRKEAQNAFIQSIMGGRGQQQQVTGERQI